MAWVLSCEFCFLWPSLVLSRCSLEVVEVEDCSCLGVNGLLIGVFSFASFSHTSFFLLWFLLLQILHVNNGMFWDKDRIKVADRVKYTGAVKGHGACSERSGATTIRTTREFLSRTSSIEPPWSNIQIAGDKWQNYVHVEENGDIIFILISSPCTR